MLTLGRKNNIMEANQKIFKKFVHSIGACKHDDSETTDFDGFLKIKYFFIDHQATQEELDDIKEYDSDLYYKYIASPDEEPQIFE